MHRAHWPRPKVIRMAHGMHRLAPSISHAEGRPAVCLPDRQTLYLV